MGQEALCKARYNGQESSGKALLETTEILFRGDFRLMIPFKEIASIQAEDGWLKIAFPGGEAALELGPKAATWREKILNPKSLLDKLGVKPGLHVSVVGVADEEFLEQLRERLGGFSEGEVAPGSDLIFLGAESREDLARIDALKASLKPDGGLWVVSPKGKQHIREMDVLNAGRGAGLTDNKVAAFSATHTASRFVIPVQQRRK